MIALSLYDIQLLQQHVLIHFSLSSPMQSTKTPGLRPMERRDIRQVTELLQKHLRRFQLAPSMGEEEVAHWFLPQDNIIDTYVVEVSRICFMPPSTEWLSVVSTCLTSCCSVVLSQGAGGVLTDFTSFYTLPSTVMHHPLHRSLKAAYSFYSVHTQTPLLDLMNDALILAKLVMLHWRDKAVVKCILTLRYEILKKYIIIFLT